MGLTRAKDTGSIGECTFLLPISCDCMTGPMPSFACHRYYSYSDWVHVEHLPLCLLMLSTGVCISRSPLWGMQDGSRV